MKESEIRIMDNKKIVAILRSEEVYEEINDIQIIDDTDIVIEGETWRVLDDEEADEYFEGYQKDLLEDLGLTSFSVVIIVFPCDKVAIKGSVISVSII